MTDANATPGEKKITRNRPTNYPRQIVILASDELADDVSETAQREGVSKAEVARRWIESGRRAERAPGFDEAAYAGEE